VGYNSNEVLLEVKPRELVIYETIDGKLPLEEWLGKLKDMRGRAIIRKRLDRVSLGNLGDAKSVGKGVSELRLILDPAIVFTSVKMATRSSCSYVVAISQPRQVI
jgi:hypothetical protein